jgi:hypothetical protein
MRGYQSTFAVSALILCAAAFLSFRAARAALPAEGTPEAASFRRLSMPIGGRKQRVVELRRAVDGFSTT